jgi:hypothetical protein
MVAERAGECFVRAVVRLQRQFEDIGCAAGERTRRLAEPPRTHITHHGKPGRGGEGANHVEARDSGDARDLVERQRAGEMAFDKPERFLGRVHGRQAFLRSPRIMTASRARHLTVLAVVSRAKPEPDTMQPRLVPLHGK